MKSLPISSDDNDSMEIDPMEIDSCYEIKDNAFKETNSINKLNPKNMISEHLLPDNINWFDDEQVSYTTK